jgi:hypothetical protein
MLGWSSYNINDINKSIVHLCECRVLSRESTGKYRIVVDWREWLMGPEGEARIRPVCATAITSLDWSHECPPPESPTIDSDESAAAPTSNLSAPSVDATEAILDDSGALRAGAYSEPSDYAPARNCYAPVSRNGICDAPPGRCNGDLQSYSSLHSESDSQSFSSGVCVSYSENERTAHQEINESKHTHTKKKNFQEAPSRNGHKIASMLPETQEAIPTVEADPVPSLESAPAAPSINDRSPTTMLKEVAGSFEPDAAHWADLEHICKFYCPDMIWNFRSYRFTFPTDVMVGALKRCLLREFDKPRTGPDQSIKINFSYVRSTMSNWKGPEGEADYDRDLRLINPPAVETPGPGAPASESTNADPYADLMANAPGMYGEWFKDHHVSMSNNPPCKGKPNGKFMDDEDFKRRMAIKARDPDRFVKLSMSYYCPSLIMERET